MKKETKRNKPSRQTAWQHSSTKATSRDTDNRPVIDSSAALLPLLSFAAQKKVKARVE